MFMMLHAFVGYLRALWADCWDYDKIPNNKLDKHFNAYHPYCGSFGDWVITMQCQDYNLGLDDHFAFNPLHNGL